MKVYIGNLDGTRQGLVVAPSKKRACELTHQSLHHFNQYWSDASSRLSSSDFKPETLYTRLYSAGPAWTEGRVK